MASLAAMAAGPILIVGAGRMGRGIAQAYALGGQRVVLIDLKQRAAAAFAEFVESVRRDIATDLRFAVELDYLEEDAIAGVVGRIETVSGARGDIESIEGTLVYEALPETVDLKQTAFEWINRHVSNDAVVASTTSTIGIDELAAMVEKPERFLHAHWLNPAHLIPLVEVAVGAATAESAYRTVHDSLVGIGKEPVRCTASPGYIVPRIQALAMNEAARMVEEGVATPADIDRAIRIGFGPRFTVMGLLEFIDWGGNDILFHASRHLARTLDAHRYRAPGVVEDNMEAGRNGLREGEGFYDYGAVDTEAYRKGRLGKLLKLVDHLRLLPAGLGRQRTGASNTRSGEGGIE